MRSVSPRSSTRSYLLRAMRNGDRHKIADLARVVNRSTTTIFDHLHRLERAGMVEHPPNNAGWRITPLVAYTGDGRIWRCVEPSEVNEHLDPVSFA